MGRTEKKAEGDTIDGLKDPPRGWWIAEAALEQWELRDRAQSKRKRERREA